MLFVTVSQVIFWASYAAMPLIAIICLIVALVMGVEPEMKVLAVFTLICVLAQAIYSVILLRGAMAGQIMAWHDRCICYEVIQRRMERYNVPNITKLTEDHLNTLSKELTKEDGSFEETEDERKIAKDYLDMLAQPYME